MIENHMVQPFADDDAGEERYCHLHELAYSSVEGCYGCAEDYQVRNAEQIADDLVKMLADLARTQV